MRWAFEDNSLPFCHESDHDEVEDRWKEINYITLILVSLPFECIRTADVMMPAACSDTQYSAPLFVLRGVGCSDTSSNGTLLGH